MGWWQFIWMKTTRKILGKISAWAILVQSGVNENDPEVSFHYFCRSKNTTSIRTLQGEGLNRRSTIASRLMESKKAAGMGRGYKSNFRKKVKSAMPKWLIFYGPKWKCKEFKAATNIGPKILDFNRKYLTYTNRQKKDFHRPILF